MAVFKRVKNSATWLQWLCGHMYRRAGLIAAKPAWLCGKNVPAVDGTEDIKCGEQRQCYMLYYSLDLFRLEAGKTADIHGQCLINGEYEPVRVCALRKDAAGERAGLKRLKHANQRKHGGKAVTELQRENNKHIMVATSLGKPASAAQILELYRARWQIELAFKRLKSLYHYNEIPAKRGDSVRAMTRVTFVS